MRLGLGMRGLRGLNPLHRLLLQNPPDGARRGDENFPSIDRTCFSPGPREPAAHVMVPDSMVDAPVWLNVSNRVWLG